MIPAYPDSIELTTDLRQVLHPLFQRLSEGISEFTFANLYLFRKEHNYRLSLLTDGLHVLTGHDTHGAFFMLPFGLPETSVLAGLLNDHSEMRCATEEQGRLLFRMGFSVSEDRSNFDYLYLREKLAILSGRKLHKKRNLVKAFINKHHYEGKPLLAEYIGDALDVLERWQKSRSVPGDYGPAREGLEKAEELQLCGGIYYVGTEPVAYSLGEELAGGTSFVTHFEKAVGGYKGLWQFVNQSFASILPEQYLYINREQDLGDKSLRKAKLSYGPDDFIKKYRVRCSLSDSEQNLTAGG